MKIIFLLISLITISFVQAKNIFLPDTNSFKSFHAQSFDLIITSQLFTQEEAKAFFGYDLISMDIRPILFKIKNQSSYQYTISRNGINLLSVGSRKILELYIPSIIPIFGYLGSLLCYSHNTIYKCVSAIAILRVLFHKYLQNRFYNVVLRKKKPLIVPVGQEVSFLVFAVNSKFKAQFEINFHNQSLLKTETFYIDLYDYLSNTEYINVPGLTLRI